MKAVLWRGRPLALLAKSGDPTQGLFEQHTRVPPAFICRLANLTPQFAGHVREPDDHFVTSAFLKRLPASA